MILYFTGTGNSKYIAKAMGHKLDDEVVSSNEYIKRNEAPAFQSEKPWVFVYPVYLSTIAEIFANFIRKADFEGSKEAYFIATCASTMGASPNLGKELCELKNFIYKGTEKVVMPQNYIAFFKMTEPEECEKRQKDALVVVEELCNVINNHGNLEGKMVSGFEHAATKLVEKMYNGSFTKTKKFHATDACVGCGICEKNCPMNRITMVDKKPKWNGSCVHCMACINQCPKQAIEYGKGTIGKQRYVCKDYK